MLPVFDLIGGGRGKGQDRAENGWQNRRVIIKQAIRILHLRELYPRLDDLYFPLWIFGYPIPNDRVREALREPLDFMVEDMGEIVEQFRALLEPETTRTAGIIEDIIDDTIYTSPVTKGLRAFSKNEMPPEIIEAGMNIFLNPDYKLNDIGFRDGLLGLKKWRERNQKRRIKSKAGDSDTLAEFQNENSSIEFIFKYAPFLKENLSLHRLQETTANCSDEVLKEVRRDMRIVTEIATAFGEMMTVLMQDAPEGFRPLSFDEFLPLLFGTAKLVAWTDISLRQKGFGEIINHLRRELPVIIRRDLTEEKKQEIAEFSPQFAIIMQESLSKLEESFKIMGLGE